MKILLSHGYFLVEDQKEQNIMRPYPPLGLLYVAAYLEQHGVENAVLDTTFSTKDNFKSYLVAEAPTHVGLYANLMTKPNIVKLIAFIKKALPQTSIILGGPDVRHNAENYLRSGADYIVLGEGEQTLLELIRFFRNEMTVEDICGVAYLDNNRLRVTAEREKIPNLDDLPLPARGKVDICRYLETWKLHHGKSAMSVSTMRGCPYTCKWCSRAVYGLSYRRRSPAKVVDELQAIADEYHPDSIWFVDDVFTISHKWLNEFTEILRSRNFKIPYECITRADRMNEEVVRLLKESGCFRVWIGAESGSQKVIDLMDRRVQVSNVAEMIRLAKKYRIETGTFIMLGYPGEEESDIRQTIQYLRDAKPDHVTVTVAYPIKGTDLYDEVSLAETSLHRWQELIDRQIDFSRTYPRKYYDFAIRLVESEAALVRGESRLRNPVLLAKSLTATLGMWWFKRRRVI